MLAPSPRSPRAGELARKGLGTSHARGRSWRRPRHRHQDFLDFLRTIDKAVPLACTASQTTTPVTSIRSAHVARATSTLTHALRADLLELAQARRAELDGRTLRSDRETPIPQQHVNNGSRDQEQGVFPAAVRAGEDPTVLRVNSQSANEDWLQRQ
jgi:hypothetical protein